MVDTRENFGRMSAGRDRTVRRWMLNWAETRGLSFILYTRRASLYLCELSMQTTSCAGEEKMSKKKDASVGSTFCGGLFAGWPTNQQPEPNDHLPSPPLLRPLAASLLFSTIERERRLVSMKKGEQKKEGTLSGNRLLIVDLAPQLLQTPFGYCPFSPWLRPISDRPFFFFRRRRRRRRSVYRCNWLLCHLWRKLFFWNSRFSFDFNSYFIEFFFNWFRKDVWRVSVFFNCSWWNAFQCQIRNQLECRRQRGEKT